LHHPDLNRGLEWGEISLRFALAAAGLTGAVVGTSKAAHLLQAQEWASKGPLDAAWVAELRSAFVAHDQGWTGQI
ncbi:MAG: aldo/keto reductase, partial [Ferruginibacter sp.]|nr:aldo/keto reductase [Rhodoferax sp.]